jgi:Flp pilus assembly pilin Flp
MLGRRVSGVLGMLALSATLVACGGSSGSSGTSPATYVKSICQAVGPFEKDVQARSSALNLSTAKSAAEGKQALQGFLTAVAADTDQAVSKLKSAGSPNVNNGKAISAAIVAAFTQLKTALTQAATQAGSLPTTSPAAFRTAAQALGTSVQSSMTSIGSSLNGLKSTELEKAAKKEAACQNLGA